MIRKAIHDAYCINLWSHGDSAANMVPPTGLNRKSKGTTPAKVGSGSSGAKKSNNDLIERQIEAGKVIAAVESLPPVEKAWVKWSYGPTLEDSVYKAFDLKQRYKEISKDLKRYKKLASKLQKQPKAIDSLIHLEDVAKAITDLERAEQDVLKVYDQMQLKTAPELFGWFEMALEGEFKRLGLVKVPARVQAKIKNLTVYWIANYRQKQRNGEVMFDRKEMSLHNGIAPNHYALTLNKWEEFVENICEQLDLLTLPKIEEIRKKINKAA